MDDGSSDKSAEILQQYQFKSPHTIIVKKQNQGKGSALQTGIMAASGDIIGIQDADFEYDTDDIAAVIEPILLNKADISYGSRFKKGSTQVHRTFHYLINRFLTLLSNVLSGLYLSDMETCYKFFRRDIIQNIRLESKRFGFEPEITAKIARLKIRVSEVPISYHPRNYLEGKKITWKDGIAACWHILRFNLFIEKKSCFHEKMPKISF